MKNIIKLVLLFSLMFSLKGVAQEPTADAKLSNITTHKGRKELRKEKRRQHNAVGLAASNERRSRKSNGTGTVNRHDAKSKKLVKDRKRFKSKEDKKREEEKDRETKDQTVPVDEKAKG